MADYTRLAPELEKVFDTMLERAKEHLHIKSINTATGLALLNKFEELKGYQRLFVHRLTELKGSKGSFMLALVEKHSTILVHKKHGQLEKEIEEIEPVLIFRVPYDMGRVFIRKETLVDKLTDLITKIDIDFPEYPAFSSRYYVAGEKPDLVRQHLPKALMKALGNTPGLRAELTGNQGLIRTEKNLSEEVVRTLINTGYTITHES